MMYFFVFCFGFLLDLCYTSWMLCTARGNRLGAAVHSMCIGGLGLAGYLHISSNYYLAAPYLLGLGCGTYVGVLRGDREASL